VVLEKREEKPREETTDDHVTVRTLQYGVSVAVGEVDVLEVLLYVLGVVLGRDRRKHLDSNRSHSAF